MYNPTGAKFNRVRYLRRKTATMKDEVSVCATAEETWAMVYTICCA